MGFISLGRWMGGQETYIQPSNIAAISCDRRTRIKKDDKGNETVVVIQPNEKVGKKEKISFWFDIVFSGGNRLALRFDDREKLIELRDHITGGVPS